MATTSSFFLFFKWIPYTSHHGECLSSLVVPSAKFPSLQQVICGAMTSTAGSLWFLQSPTLVW